MRPGQTESDPRAATGAFPLSDEATVPLPPAVRRILVGLIMAAVLMVVLDMTIANVALPHMQASLGASPETISWVLTSYILASAVMTPMTGWLGGRIGRTALFIASLAGFTCASALCGLAGTLPMEVAARFFQGVFGAFVVPLSQAMMIDLHRKEDQVRAITVWGLGAMVGPIIGPVLGGYLTDAFDWRWVFFINVPIGIATTLGLFFMLPKVPSPVRQFDKFGFVLMAVALGAFQLMLDRGTQEGWFESTEIWIEAGLALSCLWLLLIHSWRTPHPILPAALFRDRNFVASIVFIFVVGGISTASSALVSPMTQSLLGYPVMDAGFLMVPRGIMMIVGMLLVSRLMRFVDVRLLVGVGVACTAISTWVTTWFDLGMDSHLIIVSGLVLGLGLGFAMMPMNFMMGSTLPPALRTDAAAVYSLSRNIGSSIVLSVCSAMLARNVQINHEELGAHLTAQSMPLLQPGLLERFGLGGGRIAAMMDLEITRQSMMIAYLDDFWGLSIALACMIPVVLLLRPAKPRQDDKAAMGGDGH